MLKVGQRFLRTAPWTDPDGSNGYILEIIGINDRLKSVECKQYHLLSNIIVKVGQVPAGSDWLSDPKEFKYLKGQDVICGQ